MGVVFLILSQASIIYSTLTHYIPFRSISILSSIYRFIIEVVYPLQVFRLELCKHFSPTSCYIPCFSCPIILSLLNMAKCSNYESPCYVIFSSVFYFLCAKIFSCSALFSDTQNLCPFITVKDKISILM